MSVRFPEIQSANPSPTQAKPTPLGSAGDAFQKVFADSQRAHQRDEPVESAREKNSTSESQKHAKAESNQDDADRPVAKSDNEPAADKTPVERDTPSRDENDRSPKTVEKQAENEENTSEIGNDATDSTGETDTDPQGDSQVVSADEPAAVDPFAQSLPSGGSLGEAQPVASDETGETDEGHAEHVQASDATRDVDAASQLVEVEAQMDAAATNGQASAVEDVNAAVASQPIHANSPKSVTADPSSQRGGSDSLQQVQEVAVQPVDGQAAQGNAEDESQAFHNGSNTNPSVSPATGKSTDPFTLPGAVALVEPATSDAAHAAVPAVVGVEQPTEKAVAPAPLAQPQASELRDDANIARVSRGLQTAVNLRGGNITLRLDPPELGQVRIEMAVRDGVVTARMTAQTESVRRLLMDQLGQLRSSLDRQGLSIEKLDVQTASNQNSGWNGSQDQDGRSRGQYSGSQQRSRGQSHGQPDGRGDDARMDTFEQQLSRAD